MCNTSANISKTVQDSDQTKVFSGIFVGFSFFFLCIFLFLVMCDKLFSIHVKLFYRTTYSHHGPLNAVILS